MKISRTMNVHGTAASGFSMPASGFSMVELAIGIAVLFVLALGLAQSMDSLQSSTITGSADAGLQNSAEKAIAAIVADLKRSGFVAPAGAAYPYLFDDGAADVAHAIHAHAPAVHTALAGEPDFGPNREIVFLEPLDADDRDPLTVLPTPDGIPDIDEDGRLVWDAIPQSYVVVTGPDGVNVLERRVNAGSPKVVARNVERIAFDDNATSGFQVPLDAIRVRIWLRDRDSDGALHRYFGEAVVKLRNGVGDL
jgi:hypothetical protein